MTAYIALVRKEKGTSYGVDFPDFPGCITGGRTLDEAWRSAREALGAHIEWMVEDGEALPQPSSLDAVMADSHNADAVAILVPAPPVKGRAVRINVTIDENLLRTIDDVAGEGGRSGLLAEAARDYIAAAGVPGRPRKGGGRQANASIKRRVGTAGKRRG